MLRIKLSKLKQVCATAFIPTIIKETKTVKKDIEKCSIDYLRKATHKKYKSTDSRSKDENYEKRKAIIDKCFSEPTLLHLRDNEKDGATKPLSKHSNNNNSNSLISKIFESDNTEQKSNEEVLRNAEVRAIAAKIEEVKLAHDDTHIKERLYVETGGAKDRSAYLQNINEETTTDTTSNLTQDIVQNDTTPHIRINGDNVEEYGTSKASALLQHTNVQTTTRNIEDDKKLADDVVNVDKTPYGVDINAQKVSEALQEAEHQATSSKVESKKLAQHIVHIDNTPHFDIGATEIKDPNATLTVSEALQKNEDQAIAAQLEKEKLAQHSVNINKTQLVEPGVAEDNSRTWESVKNANVQATTAKIEEEKLAQKIDNIDETPHVEAGVDKVEGFNVSPKILGHDTTPNLSMSESVPEPSSNQPEQVNLEELAKKCLGKPDGDVDQILLKEMKNISTVNSLKFNFPKDDSAQKYFSQIIQDKTKNNNNIVFDISDIHFKQLLSQEMRFNNFHPLHLDTFPLVTTDTREYKDEFHKNYSPDFKNILLDIPAVLDPYNMQGIPFYQYVSKENIVLQELQLDGSSTQKSLPADTEINAPMNEDVILKRVEETESIQEPLNNEKMKDLEEGEIEDRKITTANAVEPFTEADPFSKSTETTSMSESDVSKLLEYKNVLTAQQETFGSVSPNVAPSEFSTSETTTQSAQPSSSTVKEYPLENATQTLLTTTTPTDDFGNPIQGQVGHTKAEQDKRSDEIRADTAISANQDPEEYFPTNHFNTFMGVSIQQAEYIVTDSSVTYTGVFDTNAMFGNTAEESSTDSLVSQSISYYSTFPQLSEFSNNSKDALSTSEVQVEDKEGTTHVLIQPQPKQQDVRTEFVQPERKRKELFRGDFVQEQRQEERFAAPITKGVDTQPLLDETLPLSVLLRRVRERNRLELVKSVKTEAAVAKKPDCLPPLDKSKPKTDLRPPPCQPKPKETDKCKDPNPCKPPKKRDPCAKLVPLLLHTIVRSNLDVSIPHNTRYDQVYTYISLAKEITFNKLKQLVRMLGFLNVKYRGDDVGDVVCARDFEPWVPIPSWPIPQAEKRRPFACPKEGCKLPVHPVRSNTDKPCVRMPKKLSPSKTVKLVHEEI